MSISKSQIIFTKHALDRSEQRYVTQEKIEQVLQNPDKTIQIGGGKSKFIRIIDQRHFQVVASYLAKEDKWLIISLEKAEEFERHIDTACYFYLKRFVRFVRRGKLQGDNSM